MVRRDMIKLSLAGGGLALAGLRPSGVLAEQAGASSPSSDPAELASAVTAGVAYFRRRCDEQLPLVRTLASAIASGEDGEVRSEVRRVGKEGGPRLAGDDPEAAAPYAERLVRSIERLRTELSERERFSASGQFDGMIALATEVAAKKISSEEETWSDQSLLIFRHNWIGVYSQFEPFIGVLGDRDRAAVRVRERYEQAMALVEPHFRPGSAAGTPYSRIGIAERRAMGDASNRLRDALIEARSALGIA